MVIISLIEVDIFSIFNLTIDGILFEDAGGADPMFLAQLFPKLASNWIKIKGYFGFHTVRFEL